jgi:hypothetical protein
MHGRNPFFFVEYVFLEEQKSIDVCQRSSLRAANFLANFSLRQWILFLHRFFVISKNGN